MPTPYCFSTLRGKQWFAKNQGPPGDPGSVVTSGTAAPDNANGVDGDVYLKVDTDGVVLIAYQKLAGTWTVIGDVNAPWIAYTPTVTSGAGSITSYTASIRYKFISNKTIALKGSVHIILKGTAVLDMRVTLPLTVNCHIGTFSTLHGSIFGSALSIMISDASALANIRLFNGANPFVDDDTEYTFGGILEIT